MASDNPITQASQDTLGRTKGAANFVRHVLSLDRSEGAVVGVLGAWGSGKTSYINLAEREFQEAAVPVLAFNPWMFSGADQLVQAFFTELSSQLKLRPALGDLGRQLEEYGDAFAGMAWVPVVGPWLDRIRGGAKLLATILQRAKEGTRGRRAALDKALRSLSTPIVVTVDDIDRLTTKEIRDVFKLVRLTASFPNIIYVVAFDRVRVEKALGDDNVPGREYLEKILQFTVDLPAVPAAILSKQVFTALDQALEGLEATGTLDHAVWADVFAEIVRPLIRNMRDVRRYAAAVRGAVTDLAGQVALADVLGLEAIRVFVPDVFLGLHGSFAGLTTLSDDAIGDREEGSVLRSQIEGLVDAGGAHADVIRSMIKRLFPAAARHIDGMNYGFDWRRQWLKNRRIAHGDILGLYLERVAGEGLQAFLDAERAWRSMAHREVFDDFLRSLDSERLQDVIGALETYEDEFTPEQVVPATIVLLNILPELPERPRGMFDFSTSVVVTRVTYRLLRCLNDPTAVKQALDTILPALRTLSSKLEVIDDVGYREGAGHKLVSESAALRFEKSWRQEVRSAPVDTLIAEPDLLRVLLLARRHRAATEETLPIPDDPRLTLALLKSARNDVISQSMGSRMVRRKPRLAWDALVEIFQDEAVLRERIGALRRAQLSDENDLLDLADLYLAGTRPPDDGD